VLGESPANGKFPTTFPRDSGEDDRSAKHLARIAVNYLLLRYIKNGERELIARSPKPHQTGFGNSLFLRFVYLNSFVFIVLLAIMQKMEGSERG
jgi:hypothetical protein